MAGGGRSRLLRILLIAAIVVAVPTIWAYTPILSWVEAVFVWARGAGPAGMLVYVLATALAGPVLFSSELMMAGGGFLYGPIEGFLLAWLGTNLASVINIVLARTVLRESLSHRWRDSGGPLRDLDDRMASHGLLVVTFVRLPPLSPFHVISYGLGLTRVSTRDVMIGTAIGCVPQVGIFSTLGSSVSGVEGLEHVIDAIGPAGIAALVGVTVAITVGITWLARRELGRIAAGER